MSAEYILSTKNQQMKNTNTKNKIKNLNTQEINIKTLTQSLVRGVCIVMVEEKNKFNALTPEVLGENKPIYTEALDYAFSNSDIKNIAITGIYGAGKSTIWKTYIDYRLKKNHKNIFEKNPFVNIINVSLGKYEDDSSNSTDSITKDMDNRVERQLINQMLSQIKSNNIPLSKYRFKDNVSWFGLLLRIIMTIFFVSSILMWFLKEPVVAFLNEVYNSFNSSSFICLTGFMFFIPIAIFLFTFYKENRVKLSKVNLKGAEANFKDENNDETVLERNIKEIVYLLDSSKSTLIVFEDLDRYDNIEIFTKLRELNFLLNSFIKTNENKRVIRFIYMLKDGMFLSKNRTKFFDFILPIVPVIDSKTSENKLIELLNDVENSPDRNVLANISLYIDDMRLLKNIVNEYIVYSRIIPFGKIDLESNKLFALITFKNIFPNEFDLLQKDRGLIRTVFDRLEEGRKAVANNLESELEIINEKISFINERLENNKFEAMALMIPTSVYTNENTTWANFLKGWSQKPDTTVRIYHAGGNQHYCYNNFVNEYIFNTEYKKALIEKFPEDKSSGLALLNSEAEKFKKQIRNVEIYRYKELISKMTSEQRENLFLKDNCKITKNHYFPLIRFLIVDGLLDETYWYYKGNFEIDTSVTLKRKDIIYMKSLLEGKPQDVFLDVETPIEIVNRLDVSDFNRFNILNKNILESCLNRSLDEYVIAITNSVYINNNYEELIKIIDDFGLDITEKYVAILLKNSVDNLVNILNLCKEDNVTAFKNILISLLTNTSISPATITLFSSFIEQNENLISLISEEKFETFIDNIYVAKIKFVNLLESEIHSVQSERLRKIEIIQAYKLDIQNVIFVTENILDNKIKYGNLLNEIYQSSLLVSCKDYIEDNFECFITEYIEKNTNEEHYTTDEAILIKILISEIHEDYKIKYASINETVIQNVNDLKSILECPKVFSCLLNTDKIEFNTNNIRAYWDMFKSYGEEFLEYVDRNLNYLNAKEILINNRAMCNSFINTTLVSDRLFKFVLEYADKQIAKIQTALPVERVNSLIKYNLLEANTDNIKILLNNSYNTELVMLAISDEQDREDEVITKLLEYELDDDLIYMMVNSSISDSNAMQLIESIGDRVSIEKIDSEKEAVIVSVINNGLSDININYICKNFGIFKLKTEFIEYLCEQNELEELDNENINKDIMRYILKSVVVKLDTKINLIITKINNKTSVDVLKEYISSITEISELAEVWDSRYPSLNNSYKEKISQALIKAKYVSQRKSKNYLKIWIPKNHIETIMADHLL